MTVSSADLLGPPVCQGRHWIACRAVVQCTLTMSMSQEPPEPHPLSLLSWAPAFPVWTPYPALQGPIWPSDPSWYYVPSTLATECSQLIPTPGPLLELFPLLSAVSPRGFTCSLLRTLPEHTTHSALQHVTWVTGACITLGFECSFIHVMYFLSDSPTRM